MWYAVAHYTLHLVSRSVRAQPDRLLGQWADRKPVQLTCSRYHIDGARQCATLLFSLATPQTENDAARKPQHYTDRVKGFQNRS